MKLEDYIQVAVDAGDKRPDYLMLGTKEVLELGNAIHLNNATGERWFYGMLIVVVDRQSHRSYGYKYPPRR